MEVTTLTPIFYTLSPFCSKTISFFLDSIHNTRALTQNNQSKQKNKHCSWMYFSPEWIQVFFYPQTNDLLCCPQKVTTLTKSIPFTSFCVQEHGKKAQGTLLTSHTKWVIFILSSMWCWSILWIAIFPGKRNAATELLLTHWCTGKPLYRKTVQTVPPHCCQMSEQWEILHTKR